MWIFLFSAIMAAVAAVTSRTKAAWPSGAFVDVSAVIITPPTGAPKITSNLLAIALAKASASATCSTQPSTYGGATLPGCG